MKNFIKEYIRKEKAFFTKKKEINSYFQPVLFKKLKLNIYAFKKRDRPQDTIIMGNIS